MLAAIFGVYRQYDFCAISESGQASYAPYQDWHPADGQVDLWG